MAENDKDFRKESIFEKIDRMKSFEVALYSHCKCLQKHSDLTIRESIVDFCKDYGYPDPILDAEFMRFCYNILYRMTEKVKTIKQTGCDLIFVIDTQSNAEAFRKILNGKLD